jgi:hypothetical protein
MSDIQMTNYDLNKQAYAQIDPLDERELKKALLNIGDWFSYCFKSEYFMLLCRERHDYTTIHIHNFQFDKAVQELKDLLNSRGEVLDIQFVHDSNAWECWVRERRTPSIEELEKDTDFKWTPQVWMFMLFDAQDFVIEVE